ncbi:hypothetical protein ACN61_05555 [Escherichia coli]|nr:hypothetical protein ACN61_05555 [Escherichia coli]
MTWELILDGYSESPYSATPRFAAARLPWFTLVSGPDGPLTRRYAPTSGKPLSGPLRPRTEALS